MKVLVSSNHSGQDLDVYTHFKNTKEPNENI